MLQFGIKNPGAKLEDLGIQNYRQAYWNESPEALIEATVNRGMGILSNTGALAIETGEFTGRSPKDRFIVKDDIVHLSICCVYICTS